MGSQLSRLNIVVYAGRRPATDEQPQSKARKFETVCEQFTNCLECAGELSMYAALQPREYIFGSLLANHHSRQYRKPSRYLRKGACIYDSQALRSSHSKLTI